MINDKKVLALIPARGGSKGIRRKNLIELCGRPLVGWPIGAALGSKYIDTVAVSTEDYEIAAKSRELGAEVPFVRPIELASDTATSASVILHALDFFKASGKEFDYLVLLEPTSPLTESWDVDAALEKLDLAGKLADSIIGVSKLINAHPAFSVSINSRGLVSPYLSDFSSAGRRQDIKELYFLDGSLYISDTAAFIAKKTFYHERTLAHVMPKWKSFEIDDMVDLVCVEGIMKGIDRIRESEMK